MQIAIRIRFAFRQPQPNPSAKGKVTKRARAMMGTTGKERPPSARVGSFLGVGSFLMA
jgi:hypothetical protein